MSKIKIDKNDKFRVILTELLPYEVPMLFSNEGFYSIIKKGALYKYFKKISELKNSKEYGIPFDYQIRKNSKDSRKLSVIHPINQIDFIDFYYKYNSLILNLCSKSPFSLRYPSKIAKYCYSPDLLFDEDEHMNEEVEVEPEILDQETKLLKSFFTYQKYDLIYKFYENYEYVRLEQRFSKLMEFDIHKCFYNLYTHSITWAVKNKELSKINRRAESFENGFDTLMQKSNYNETNGIVVGPEVSRIFAEIILQQIDLNVLEKLNDLNKSQKGLRYGVDVEIRRYVDDFFVFSNEDKVLDIVLEIYRKELESYKLYINNSKTQKRERPFITNISVGKHQLFKELENLCADIILPIQPLPEDSEFTKFLKVTRPNSLSRKFVKDFQCITKSNNISYDVICKEVIRFLKKILTQLIRDDKIKKEKNEFKNFSILILDIAFHAYSLDVTVSTTYKISQMIVLLSKHLKNFDVDIKHEICSKIIRESEFVMTSFQRSTKPHETNVEILNLLIALKSLEGDNYRLSEKKLRELFSLKEPSDFSTLNYFQIVSLLYYIENSAMYRVLREEIEKEVIRKFLNENDPFSKAEFTCLFFDYMTCPFVTIDSKRKVSKHSGYSKQSDSDIDVEQRIADVASETSWFMNWDKDINLERILKKKEWGSSY